MREGGPTVAESAFFGCLSVLVPRIEDWYHADEDGTPWMTASFDDIVDGVMTVTWRVDFDGDEVVGGRSPANLNWDDGVRGRSTGMCLEPPDGLVVQVSSAEQAAQVVADWLARATQGRSSA